jgi:hypothetical protein
MAEQLDVTTASDGGETEIARLRAENAELRALAEELRRQRAEQGARPIKDAQFVDGNTRLMLIEAFLFAAIAVVGAAVTYEVMRDQEPLPLEELTVAGMIDAEALPVVRKQGQYDILTQDTSQFSGGQWTGNRQLFVAARAQGDALTLQLPSRDPGVYDLTLYLSKSYDYGIVQVSVNGERVGQPLDLWAWGVEATGPVRLGTVRLRGDGDVIEFEVTGKNEQATSPFYQFGVDGVVLKPVP